MRDDLVAYWVDGNVWLPIKPLCEEFGIPTPKEDSDLYKLLPVGTHAGSASILSDDGVKHVGNCISMAGLLTILVNRPELVMNDARLAELLPILDFATITNPEDDQ